MTWFDAAQKIATALAALVAAWVAVQGLRAWQVQLQGKAEYDLARRVLRAAFKVRDQIAQVRSPSVPLGEMVQAYKDAGLDPDGVDITRDMKRCDSLVYQRRWQPLAGALSDLSLEMLEAEVLWGDTVRECERRLQRCTGELNAALSLYLRDIHADNFRHPEKAAERIDRQFAIVYAIEADDEFARKIDGAIEMFETTFRPHLRLSRLFAPRRLSSERRT